MENAAQSLSGLKKEDFQKVIQGKQVDLYFLHNANGMEVAITNYGGALVAIMVLTTFMVDQLVSMRVYGTQSK